jgi:hypothetical protein
MASSSGPDLCSAARHESLLQGFIVPTRKVWLQVHNALQSVESSIDAASREIFAGRLAGHAIYMPRLFASWICLGAARPFPSQQVQALCAAIRTVARLLLSLFSLFENGVTQAMSDVIMERFPEDLVPRLVEHSGNILEVCTHELSERASWW